MSFTNTIPPSPTSSASSGSSSPRTPDSSSPSVPYPSRLALPMLPDLEGRTALENYDESSAGGVKRTLKMKQRISTAERRASHNAVERQRREALNERFLELAAVLPNLRNIRRPSKSSIVHSSIAFIGASRRHRIIAAQELRSLAEECQQLRAEANQWRARAGVMRLDTPSRGESFSMVLGEELHYDVGEAYDDEDAEEYGAAGIPYRDEMMRMQLQQQAAAHSQSHFVHNLPQTPTMHQGTSHARSVPASQSPIIASPTLYDNYDQLQFQQLMMQQAADDKMWAYAPQMMHAQAALEAHQILAQERSVAAGGW
ncbi:Macrophage erythroblast attacher isoform 1 [Mycena kentingensis (nom. inval.)]|nr:Macrophage erythroblast attacher isoform 1 [Mycena kentingensis (nom. inval.)]